MSNNSVFNLFIEALDPGMGDRDFNVCIKFGEAGKAYGNEVKGSFIPGNPNFIHIKEEDPVVIAHECFHAALCMIRTCTNESLGDLLNPSFGNNGEEVVAHVFSSLFKQALDAKNKKDAERAEFLEYGS